MKKTKRLYETPSVEVAEIAVEQGIAATGDGGSTAEDLDWNDEMGW